MVVPLVLSVSGPPGIAVDAFAHPQGFPLAAAGLTLDEGVFTTRACSIGAA
jgi:hypothetical protein